MKITKSEYKSAAGNKVTLYANEETGRMATVVEGEITIYGSNGDMMCGASNEAAMMEILGAA